MLIMGDNMFIKNHEIKISTSTKYVCFLQCRKLDPTKINESTFKFGTIVTFKIHNINTNYKTRSHNDTVLNSLKH